MVQEYWLYRGMIIVLECNSTTTSAMVLLFISFKLTLIVVCVINCTCFMDIYIGLYVECVKQMLLYLIDCNSVATLISY